MNFLTNLSLWKKITILTTIGLALGAGVFSTLGIRAVNEATEAMLQDRLTTAHLVADYVDESLVQALNGLNNSAQIIEADEQSNHKSVMEALQAEYSRLSIYICNIYLTNQESQIIYSQTELLQQDNTYTSFPSDVIQAIEKGESTVSRMGMAPGTNIPVVFLTSPIKMEQTGEKYALVVAIDLAKSSIGIFVRPLKLGKTGYVEIVDQSGVVITRTEPGPKLESFEKSDHSGRFVALIDAGKPTRGVCHTCHESQEKVKKKDVLAFVPLSNVRWGVVVRQSEEEAMAPANKLYQNLIFYGLGLVIVALLFVVVTTHDVGNRIRILTVAARRIASGDLTSPVATLGKDEVGILAQTFDDMRDKLRNSYGNLEQKTKELTSLLSVSEILTSTLDLPGLLDAVVTKAVELISSADSGVLLLEKTNHERLIVQSAVGLDKEAISQSMLTCNMPQVNPGAEPPEAESKSGIHEAINTLLESDVLSSRVLSYTYAEIFQRSRCIGVLVLFSFQNKKAFSDSDYRLLQAIADDISIAIEKAQLAREADEARALYEADRLRSQFISSVSHELRTPLTIIKGYATSLLRQNVNWDKNTQQEFLRSIDEKTDELRDLIDKILQSAKLEAGALKLEREPILLPRIAKKIVEENIQWTKRHKFILKFPSSFPVVEADARCIEQVVRNLAENAVKYSPDGGEIVLAGKIMDNEVVFSISDQGAGIPQNCQDKIFERFFRVDSRLTHSVTGSGLGLSICKGHIKAHDGKIWFESTPGKGSKFYFSLPLNKTEDLEVYSDGESVDDRENINSLS